MIAQLIERAMTADTKRALETMRALEPGIGTVIAPTPSWLAPLFAAVGKDHNVAPELLEAIARVRSRFDPNAAGGIMGLPADFTEGNAIAASIEDLRRHDRAAVTAVANGVTLAARHLDGNRDNMMSALADLCGVQTSTVLGFFAMRAMLNARALYGGA